MGETPVDATERVRRDPLVPLIEQDIPKALGYPESFLKAVDKALSVDEEDRPQSITAWQDMLSGRVDVGEFSSKVVDEMANTEYLPRKARNGISLEQTFTPANDTNQGSAKPKIGLIFGGIAAVAVTGLGIALMTMGGQAKSGETGSAAEQTEITPELAEAWGKAKALGTIEAYEAFLGEWPNGQYANEARSSIERLNGEAIRAAFDTAIAEAEATDKAAYEAAKSNGRVSAFGEYVQNYPDGKHHVAADNGAWQSAQRLSLIHI